jgi:LysR family transcriptional regulator, nitrogen assimilation regulatory protein
VLVQEGAAVSRAGITTRQLRYFVVVADARSFSSAARTLNVSQPALGLQVRDLEARVGAPLLHRHARGTALTPAGESFYPYAVEALAAIERAERSVASFVTGASEKIVLGVTPTLGRVLVEELVGEGDEVHGPRLELREGLTAELVHLLQAQEIDAAFCYDPPDDAAYDILPLFDEDLALVSRPGLPDFHETIALCDLARFPLALGPHRDASRQAIESVTSKAGVQLDVRAEIAPTSLKREVLIRRGLCSIVPFGLFLPEIQAGLLVSASITPPIRRTMTLATRRGLATSPKEQLAQMARNAITKRIRLGVLRWRPLL